ncbi:MAG TPA: FAD:protein FMN transferase [Terriglobia bacterium]|nr:FAD:protein FMN transferase [Terriglobia bacterium]
MVATILAEATRFEYSADAMGGVFSIALFSESRTAADKATTAAFAELRRLDHLLSNYLPDSEWSELNRSASHGAVSVSAELFDLLSVCLEFSRRSEGAFDITVGPLLRLWGFYDGVGKSLEPAGVQQIRAQVGYTKLVLDPINRTVHFKEAGMELDPGGVGKGYAVDRMIELLKRNGIQRALVSAAGSSIFAVGTPPGRTGWPVDLSDPKQPGADLDQLLLKDQSLSTSGCSKKFVRVNGQVYCHIMDPRTGYPVRGTLQVSVVAPRTLESEIWTKAVFVNGRRWSVQHIPAGYQVHLCEEQSESSHCGWLPSPPP